MMPCTSFQFEKPMKLISGFCRWTVALLILIMPTEAMADEQLKSELPRSEPFVIVVTDPLSERLACDCVEGYAQRKYEALGRHLQSKIGSPVEVYFGDSVESALRDENQKRERPLVADLVIGKHSVIAFEAKDRSWNYEPIAQLTGKDGDTTQWGLVVVRGADPALVVDDLEGYRILFGPANCDEKNSAPRLLIEEAGIKLPEKLEIASACSVAAKQLLDSPSDEKVAAIISSYAAPLLEGCGNVKKGDLRVIGKSEPVPFISAFVRGDMESDLRRQVQTALNGVRNEPKLLEALETRDGFVAFESETETTQTQTSKKKVP